MTPTGTEAAVCADIAARQAFGLGKYGISVQDNPLPLREWLQHAYEETLDKAVYLKRSIDQIDRDAKAAKVIRSCSTCLHYTVPLYKAPCRTCINATEDVYHPNWTPNPSTNHEKDPIQTTPKP